MISLFTSQRFKQCICVLLAFALTPIVLASPAAKAVEILTNWDTSFTASENSPVGSSSSTGCYINFRGISPVTRQPSSPFLSDGIGNYGVWFRGGSSNAGYWAAYIDATTDVLNLTATQIQSIGLYVSRISTLDADALYTYTLSLPNAGMYSWTGNISVTDSTTGDLSSKQYIVLTRSADSVSSSQVFLSVTGSGLFNNNYGSCLWNIKIDKEDSPPETVMPVPAGGVYSFEVDPSETEVVDSRDYVRRLFETFADNDYFPAIYYPYYTMSMWRIADTYNYVVLTISENPIINKIDAVHNDDNEVVRTRFLTGATASLGSQMTYIGIFTDINEPITFYYTNYYAPAIDPQWFYDSNEEGVPDVKEWLGLQGQDFMAQAAHGLPIHRTVVVDSEHVNSEWQHYLAVTNYTVEITSTLPDDVISSTSSIPSGYMTLYQKFFAAGNDANNSILGQILEKVTHIDNDLHEIFGDVDPESSETTKAIDDTLSQGQDSAKDAFALGDDVIGDLSAESDTVNSAIGQITSALGAEWTMMVSLMVFAIVAILLQRRTG